MATDCPKEEPMTEELIRIENLVQAHKPLI